jgi:transposase
VVRFETLPGRQTQADWKHIGEWQLGTEMVALFAMVAVLGHSRKPAIRIASSMTREVSFERLVRCLDDLGGLTREVLTDRDTVFCNHHASGPLLVPEWVDLCEQLGIVPKVCRPYRPQTKGKVERVNREVEESFRIWLTNQVLPLEPTLKAVDRRGGDATPAPDDGPDCGRGLGRREAPADAGATARVGPVCR